MFNKEELLQNIQFNIYYNLKNNSKPEIFKYELTEPGVDMYIKIISENNFKLFIPLSENYELLILDIEDVSYLFAVVHRYVNYIETYKESFNDFLNYSYIDIKDLHYYLTYYDFDNAKEYFKLLGEFLGIDKLKEIIDDINNSYPENWYYKLDELDESDLDEETFREVHDYIDNHDLYIENNILFDINNKNHIPKHILVQLKNKGYDFNIQKTLDYYKKEQIKLIEEIIESLNEENGIDFEYDDEF